MEQDNLLEELDKLIKINAEKTGNSLGSYYRKIVDYCKKRIKEK